ncbi:hypothetical protein I316_07815 [Kwoniella heveanensis BCC8398]|uniref:RNB domain-containing protein n=1 Tax=Kwoniella heveanensis BCC8398 TaxID=1296120 RepID=A0A1B9GHU4_9TREE|nr:hypothetical protein I316_07815 [Kwoniella heveanensis BCC8398]
MKSIRIRPIAGPSRLASTRRTLITSSRVADTQSYRTEYESDAQTPGSSRPIKEPHRKTAEFLYGPDSGWRKPKVPRKAPTPPKHRPKVDPEAYKNLPDLEPTQLIQRDRLVEFSLAEGQSNDRRAYFANDVDEEVGADWSSAEVMEDTVGLETGRVVECRRSGHTSVGLILASLSVAGKHRLLLLRSSGEIWPISTHDVQFVMPSSLIPSSLVSKCWSPELLESWSQSESKAGLTEESVQPSSEMMDARRKVAMVLRKVSRETEKMCGRLMAGTPGRGNVGGVEGLWESLAVQAENSEGHEGRTSVTAVQAAEYILNGGRSATDLASTKDKFIEIKPNTLPAYAAHVILMRRPDLFTADQGDMWASGTFVVRSRAERRMFENVQNGVDIPSTGEGESSGDKEALNAFVKKAKKAIGLTESTRVATEGQPLAELRHELPEWTNSDKEFISTLLAPLVETRSTQTPPSLSLAITIARLITPYPEGVVDRGTIARMLQDMGIILPWDSLEMSKTAEIEQRGMIMSSIPTGRVNSADELLQGNELDDLREDYTSHKVYVIDDPTASELDDGIALERIHGSDDVWVHIHIADPTRFIAPSHPLALQASVRGSALYLPEGNKPLFPLEVIMKELSLGADVKTSEGAQGVLTFSAKLNTEGEVQDSKVKMGWIRKPRVVTYGGVDKAMGIASSSSVRPFGGPQDRAVSRPDSDVTPTDLEDLRVLFDFAKAHRARRYANAGFEWSLPSANVSILDRPSTGPSPNLFDNANTPSSPRLFSGTLRLDYRVSPPSLVGALNAGSMVAEYMILAGRLAASFCHSNDIPVIYRGSSAPKPLTAEAGSLEDLMSARMEGTGIVDPYKMMSSGWYRPAGYVSLSPVQHWIMGFDQSTFGSGYIRATSPLRRFDDILVHWQIKAHLARQANLTSGGLNKGFTKEEVAALVKRSDEGTKRAKRAGLNAQKFWQAQLISRHLRSSPASNVLSSEEGWTIDESERVDVRGELVARIAGATESSPSTGGEVTNIIIESLGAQARMTHPALQGGREFEAGQGVRVKLTDAAGWPNPHIRAELVE